MRVCVCVCVCVCVSVYADKSAGQFRLIQKRLLVRFKDRNPAPLKDLDSLLQVCLYVNIHTSIHT